MKLTVLGMFAILGVFATVVLIFLVVTKTGPGHCCRREN